MLRVVSDREVAREAARVNLSALLLGQTRIVPSEGRFSAEPLKDTLTRGWEDLGEIRRAVSRLLERAAPMRALPRLTLSRDRDSGPER